MKRYDSVSGASLRDVSDGEYVRYSEAQDEIEKRGKQIDLLNQAIATLITDRDTAMSMLEDAEARVLRQKEEISALKSSLNCGDLCAEVTELKADNVAWATKHFEEMAEKDRDSLGLRHKLTHLTALIESDEEAEKVVEQSNDGIHEASRYHAINDYRAMLLEVVGK
jgi:DNA repair exonuclease SbcCD ATPase subunit